MVASNGVTGNGQLTAQSLNTQQPLRRASPRHRNGRTFSIGTILPGCQTAMQACGPVLSGRAWHAVCRKWARYRCHPGGAHMTDRIADPWGPRTPFSPSQLDAEWPARIDQYLAPGIREEDIDRWVQVASVLHSNGDAMDIAVKEGRIVGVRGRAVDRVNRGRLGPKDLFAWQANAAPDRLQRPLVREDGRLVETDWETAMGRIVARTQKLLAEPAGKQKISFYSTGQLFLEEYYTLGVIGKAGIGTPQ